MPVSAHRTIVVRAHEACNAGRFEDLDAVLADDILYVMDGGSLRGRAAFCDFIAGVRREAPGCRMVLDRVLADSDDTIVTRTRYVDTSAAGSEHAARGAWPLPATRCAVHRIAEGRIVEWRDYIDPESVDEASGGGQASLTGIQQLISEQAAPSGA